MLALGTCEVIKGALVRRVSVVVVLGLLGFLLASPTSATVIGSEGSIVFVRANQIYTMSKTGTGVKQLTSVGKNYRPKWSPDGQRIAYINEDTAGRKDVFLMSASGTGKTKVTTSGKVQTTPVWSPDGTTLAFAQTGTYSFASACYPSSCPEQPPRDYSGNYVFLVKSTTPYGPPTLLSTYPSYTNDGYNNSEPISAYQNSSIAWSPNGSDLAIVNGDTDDAFDTGLHLVHGMRGATPALVMRWTHPEELINGTNGDCCGYEDWNDINYIPNSTLGYSVLDYGNEFEYEDNPRAKLNYPGFVSQLGDKAGAPSPNGKNMVFVRTTGTTPNIWTATIKGAQRKQILANGYQPDWQPLP